jgi:recombination protein RecR
MTQPRDPLAELQAALQRLPGIGAKSAQRLAYHILKTPRADVDGLCDAMRSVKDHITYCSICSNITAIDPCLFCVSPDRDARQICVVEQPENVAAIEKTRGFKGRYHVLMGAIAPLQGIGPDDLRIKPLLTRVAETETPDAPKVEEVILATNPTVEGEATALYLARLLKPLGVRVTRIAMGVPVGGDLDYTDEFTVGKALEGRREM